MADAQISDQGEHFDVICQIFTDNVNDEESEDLTFDGDVNRAKKYSDNQLKNQTKIYTKKNKHNSETIIGNDAILSRMYEAGEKNKRKRNNDLSSNISVISDDYEERPSNLKMATASASAISSSSSSSSTSVCSLSSSLEETRLQYLMRVPSLMQNATNSSDFEKLKFLIDDAFTKNCYVKTAYMNLFQGCDKLFKAILATKSHVPDYYILHSEPKIYKHCISLKHYAFGSSTGDNGQLSKDENKHLWNPFESLPEIEKMDEEMLKLKQKYDRCVEQNIPIRFVQKAIAFYILNKEMTHFEARIIKAQSLQLFEDKQQMPSNLST